MKPLLLDLQAFMPYGTRQVLDFRELGTQRLMMIAGETGSGKTAILDAMAYGLFGASTGGARTEQSYRSHHAQDGTLTYVDFRFELQGHVYRVVRYPPQRGKSQGAYEFWRLSKLDTGDGELLISGKTKVNQEVENRLGYNLSQFRSVIMLPQGKFREFLAAKTDKKAEILSTLFRTTRYEKLQNELYERFKKLEGEQSDNRKQIEGILKRAEAENEEQLKAAIDLLKNDVETTNLSVSQCAHTTAACAKEHDTQTRLVDKFDQLQKAQAALDALTAQASQHAVDVDRLNQAQLAAQVAPDEKHLKARQDEVTALEVRLKSAHKRVHEATHAEADAKVTLAAEKTRDAARDALRRELVNMEALIEKLESLQVDIEERDSLSQQGVQADTLYQAPKQNEITTKWPKGVGSSSR